MIGRAFVRRVRRYLRELSFEPSGAAADALLPEDLDAIVHARRRRFRLRVLARSRAKWEGGGS